MEKGPIKYKMIGSPQLPVDLEEDELEFFDNRIGKLEGLEDCTKVKVLYNPQPNSP